MTDHSSKGERIAKHLSRAGVASRRAAEAMILGGRVHVNGQLIDSPALNVGPKDKILVDGQPLAEADATRMWLYHKPTGLVTSERDEKGRETVFEALPAEMPRVMSIGRLDMNSEGLLLLTNDGEIKRRLELPSTGWARRYRVRVHGRVADSKLEKFREGITVDGMTYQPMAVMFDRQQGTNSWLTVTIREGKNREIRRAMEAIGVTVNRLIRVSYGPFKLENLARGEVREVKRRVLRDQLGLDGPGSDEARDEEQSSGVKQGRKHQAKHGAKHGANRDFKRGAERGDARPSDGRGTSGRPGQRFSKASSEKPAGRFAPKQGQGRSRDSADETRGDKRSSPLNRSGGQQFKGPHSKATQSRAGRSETAQAKDQEPKRSGGASRAGGQKRWSSKTNEGQVSNGSKSARPAKRGEPAGKTSRFKPFSSR